MKLCQDHLQSDRSESRLFVAWNYCNTEISIVQRARWYNNDENVTNHDEAAALVCWIAVTKKVVAGKKKEETRVVALFRVEHCLADHHDETFILNNNKVLQNA